ncbi:hypothetical protein AAG906_040625 [Vitis piasezkii]
MLVNVRKLAKGVQLFPLGTLIGATKEYVHGHKVIAKYGDLLLSLWKGIFSRPMPHIGGDGGINIGEVLATSLKNKHFSPILCLFDEDSISMASFNRLCCHSWNLTIKLTTIYFLASSIIGGTTGSAVSHHSVYSAPDVSSGLVTVS